MSLRWEEVAAFSQVVVKALRVVSELKLSDAQSEYISLWLIDGDGVDFPGLSHFFSYGEKVPLEFTLYPRRYISCLFQSLYFFFFVVKRRHSVVTTQ